MVVNLQNISHAVNGGQNIISESKVLEYENHFSSVINQQYSMQKLLLYSAKGYLFGRKSL